MQIIKPNISEHTNVNFNLKLFKTFLGTQQQTFLEGFKYWRSGVVYGRQQEQRGH